MERIKNKETFVLIDTLTGSHFEKVHLPGARSACVFEVTFLEQVEAIADGKRCRDRSVRVERPFQGRFDGR